MINKVIYNEICKKGKTQITVSGGFFHVLVFWVGFFGANTVLSTEGSFIYRLEVPPKPEAVLVPPELLAPPPKQATPHISVLCAKLGSPLCRVVPFPPPTIIEY